MRVAVGADLPGTLVRRYKRFLADVETRGGRVLTVHCPDPGSMRGLASAGAAVRCSTSDDPRRKLRHSLEMIRVGRAWVGTNPARANTLAARVLEAEFVPELAGYRSIEREVASAPGSRLDFRLGDHPRRRDRVWLEVKSVTLAEGRRARFPDSTTLRGRRHMEELARLARRKGQRAALLFVVQRADCDVVEPADDIDPAYGEALRRAAKAGVLVFAVGARVTGREIRVERRLEVRL